MDWSPENRVWCLLEGHTRLELEALKAEGEGFRTAKAIIRLKQVFHRIRVLKMLGWVNCGFSLPENEVVKAQKDSA